MKLYVDKMELQAPTGREAYALALVLTPLGCEGPSGTGCMSVQRRLLDDPENDWQLAADLDLEDFLVVFLQIWEASDPLRSNAILAALRTRLERTPLGRRLVRGEGIPSEGIARSGGSEVMRIVWEALVQAGDVLVMGDGLKATQATLEICKGMMRAGIAAGITEESGIAIGDVWGRAKVFLRLEAETKVPGVAREPSRHFEEPQPSGFPLYVEAEGAAYDPGNGPGTFDLPWRQPRTWSEVTVGREVLWYSGGEHVQCEVIQPEGQAAARNKAYLQPRDALASTVRRRPEAGMPREAQDAYPIVVTQLNDFKIRDPALGGGTLVGELADPLDPDRTSEEVEEDS